MPGSSHSSEDWQLLNDRIVLNLPDGTVYYPTAIEITRAEFKNQLSVAGIVISRKPSQSIPNISFHRFPLDAKIEIAPPDATSGTPPFCSMGVYSAKQRVAGYQLPPQDNIVHQNNWYPVDANSTEALLQALKFADIVEPGQITYRQYLKLINLGSGVAVFVENANRIIQQPQSQAADIPEGLDATLYPYQTNGYHWLSRIADEGLGCILADQMGLGKTLQVIALLLREQLQGKTPSLVIATATLLENWRRELARFAPSLSVCVHRGRERTGFPRLLENHDVVVTSYDTAKRDLSILEMIRWNIVVLDEAQAIKTPHAQRTKALKTIPRHTGIAVTGTPVENRLRDLWSLMDFAIPGLLGTQREFEKRFSDEEHDARSLEPLITPMILRRLVVDVASDLPERIDIPQPVELSEESAIRYDAIRRDILASYGKAASIVALTKLRMYCTHPRLLNAGTDDLLDESTKYTRMTEILEEIFEAGDKVLIFTSFTEMADILVSDIQRRFGVPVSIIDGRTEVTDRQPTVDRFCELETSAALVLNPRAAGTGLNITAATHVIHYNLEWNPAIEDQATARAYRRGQTRPVTVHRLFHPGTVEEVIDQRMARKRLIADSAIVGTDGEDGDFEDIMRSLELSPLKERNM